MYWLHTMLLHHSSSSSSDASEFRQTHAKEIYMKEFNYTGICIPSKHYMVHPKKKIDQIIGLIEKNKYFTINLPRQYGKSTSIYLLEESLKSKHLVISTSFEGIGETFFSTEKEFCRSIIHLFIKDLFSNRMDIVITLNQNKFVIELKIWHGEKYAQEGREQLCNYLDSQNLKKGYMVFFNFNQNKSYEIINRSLNNKDLFEITV